MRSISRTLAALAAVAALAVACTASGAPASSSPAPASAVAVATPAPPTPVPTPKVITAPPATPKPMTDGKGDEHIVGVITNAVLSTPYTRTTVGATGQIKELIRGGVATFTMDMNDARVNGTATWAFSIDAYGVVGSEWGPLRLATDQGAWDGTCSGGSWSEGDGLVASCWLAGSGAYKGYTYYMTFTGPSNGDKNGNGIVQGIVFPGVPPMP
jgi:hypothetical protein